MARKHRMPRTAGQFLALSMFGCFMMAAMCGWNWVRYDMRAIDTLLLQPAPDKWLVSKANRHLVFIPFATFIVVGGLYGAAFITWKQRVRRRVVSKPLVEIRQEQPADHPSIHRVTTAAFSDRPYSDGDEQDVIDRLRACGALTLSLVAESRGEVVGQITFSPAEQADGSGPWYALGPVSVEPGRQSEGIGGMLINEGLEQITAMGALGCILTGNPVYYQRFGFEVTPELSPDNEPGEYFQLKLLTGDRPTGKFSFHPAFYGDD